MLLDIIKKGIENITLQDIDNLFQNGIATIKNSDNELVFIQE